MDEAQLPKEVNDAINRGLTAHFNRVLTYYKGTPVIEDMEYYLKKLMKPDYLGFTINTIHEKIMQLKQQGLNHLFGTKSFSDTYLTVSLVPAIDPAIAAGFFDRGYLEFFSGLVQQSGWEAGGVNVAHWVACLSDQGQLMYHFSYYPMKPDNEDDFYPLLAQDLLNDTEKRQIGLI